MGMRGRACRGRRAKCLACPSCQRSAPARLRREPRHVWRLGDLDGKPEGLAFTAQGRAIVGLDTRKRRRNLVLLEPAVAQLRGRGRA